MKKITLSVLLSSVLVLTLVALPVSSVAETKGKVFKWNWQTYASPATDMYKLLQ
jgi:ABC-type arginine/histidine transport system permease subunit